MRSKEWLYEAESNFKVKKQLGLLSDTDIDTVLGLLQRVNEQDEPYDPRAKFRKKNKFVDAPAIATPAVQTNKSTSSTSNIKSSNIESIVKNLSQKDKELLAATLQKEKEQRLQKRQRSPSQQAVPQTPQEPKKSSGMLGKIVLFLLVSLGTYQGLNYLNSPVEQRLISKIDVGMSKQQVQQLMGKNPDENYLFDFNNRQEEWHYNGEQKAIVHFADNKVIAVKYGDKTLELDRSGYKKFKEKIKIDRIIYGQYSIKIGMTYNEVTNILGSPDHELQNTTSRYGTSQAYSWNKGSLFDNIIVTFDNGRVDAVSR